MPGVDIGTNTGEGRLLATADFPLLVICVSVDQQRVVHTVVAKPRFPSSVCRTAEVKCPYRRLPRSVLDLCPTNPAYSEKGIRRRPRPSRGRVRDLNPSSPSKATAIARLGVTGHSEAVAIDVEGMTAGGFKMPVEGREGRNPSSTKWDGSAHSDGASPEVAGNNDWTSAETSEICKFPIGFQVACDYIGPVSRISSTDLLISSTTLSPLYWESGVPRGNGWPRWDEALR
ncbi:hypothetical protein QBC47DRAFT_361985 [Echria macrotheca]|uniref:Uncharacterized protein n=1 Tax=Echria macrotheca TaxID=438768 RepID=A0AAJ0BBH4_9PEZI|nr:hypothetical protein QBC47DRAFT_361985 [Echria macrotheca]